MVISPRMFFPALFQCSFVLIIQISIRMSPTQEAKCKVAHYQSLICHFCFIFVKAMGYLTFLLCITWFLTSNGTPK